MSFETLMEFRLGANDAIPDSTGSRPVTAEKGVGLFEVIASN